MPPPAMSAMRSYPLPSRDGVPVTRPRSQRIVLVYGRHAGRSMARKDPLEGARTALDAARRGDVAACDALVETLDGSLARGDDEARGLAVSVLAASARHAA